MSGGWVRLAAAFLVLAVPVAGEDFDKAFKVYQVWVKRPSLHKRTLARERLARTGDPRALHQLIQDYARPEEPKDQVRYLIAYMAAETLQDEQFFPIFDEWRAKADKAPDAWLWYQALRNRVTAGGAAEAMAVAKSDRNVFLRAAAIEALRFEAEQDLLPFVREIAAKLPSDAFPRAVLLESLTALLCSRLEQVKTQPFADAAADVLARMDEPATLDRTRLAMGRQFAKLFKTRFVWRDGARWRQELEFLARGGMQAKDDRYAKPPTFAGIETTGDRICYVIDLSDSMLEPLTPLEMERLPKGPVTGRPQQKAAESDRWQQALEAVKWDKVKNKFDAAREMLKTSLLMLDEKKSFCVICFGDGAGPLKGTKGIQKATLDNIQAVIKILDGIHPGPPKNGRPHGTLLGDTNIHGGLHRAFKVKSGTLVGPGEYVNPSTFDDGCDTIFLLSDGAPTCDDWPSPDSRDTEDLTVGRDPETGQRLSDSKGTAIFQGPYQEAHHVIGDVARLNLFRKVEIHCVGMGGTTMNILETIAVLGKGQALDLTGGPANAQKK